METEGTKFEKDLKAYFPDIYDLYVYGKQEPKVWKVIYSLIEMKKNTQYGDVTVTFQAGKIQHAYKNECVTAEFHKRLTVREEEM